MISIITPFYNTGNNILRLIDSINNQDSNNFEVIFIDDGSTDDTTSIINKYISKDVNYSITSIKNSGTANARNVGIRKSSHKYISFIDSDDYIATNFISHLINKILTWNSDIICFNLMNVEIKKGNIIEKDFLYIEEVVNTNDTVSSLLIAKEHGISTNKIYRKDFIKKNNILFDVYDDKKNYVGEDTIFMLKSFLKAKTVSRTAETLYYYAYNENSISENDLFQEERDFFINKIFEYLEINKIDYNNNAFYLFFHKHMINSSIKYLSKFGRLQEIKQLYKKLDSKVMYNKKTIYSDFSFVFRTNILKSYAIMKLKYKYYNITKR